MSKRTTPSGRRLAACRWCGQQLVHVIQVGRPRQFCRPSHRTAYHFWARWSAFPVTLRDLIQREGLRCGICSGPIDLAATGKLAAVIDHIIPVARGGSNEISNLQVAHKRCNSMKCDRLDFHCPPIGEEGTNPQLSFPGFPNESRG